MMNVFVFLIFAQFAITASHDLIDIPGWNHGSQVKELMGTRKVWIATMINSIFPGVAVVLAVYFWHRSTPRLAQGYWLVYCAISLLSAIGMWYIPYWRGASEKTQNAYRAMYAGTRHILPARGDNPRPNVGVPGDFCTSVNETNWYERSLEWHEGRSIHRSRS